MILTLSDGKTLEKGVGCALMALRVNAVTLESEDLHKLLKMDDGQMRFWLSSLYRRLEARSEDA
jgi:hypothetical protein